MVADYLSHLESGKPTENVYNDLLDAEVFGITSAPPNMDSEDRWIGEMLHFLSIGLPPDYLSLDVKKRLVIRSQNFYLITDTLYHKGTDRICRQMVRNFEKDTIL